MAKPASGQWHRAHREKMSALRRKRRRQKKCRQCELPAAVNKKTGKRMSACRKHLDEDRARVLARQKANRRAR